MIYICSWREGGAETERRAHAFRRGFIDIRLEIFGSALTLRELYVQGLEEFIRSESGTSMGPVV